VKRLSSLILAGVAAALLVSVLIVAALFATAVLAVGGIAYALRG
jgi:hypothetical protein